MCYILNRGMSRNRSIVIVAGLIVFFFAISNYDGSPSAPSTSTSTSAPESPAALGTLDPHLVADASLSSSSSSAARSLVVMEKNAETSSSCALRANSFRELGTFPFWGRQMNSSFPCPASGMNNQLTLMLAFWHCFDEMERSRRSKLSSSSSSAVLSVPAAAFRWKDISCSPTGGKDGNRKFAVGSFDYVYAWFRWSEVYRVLPKSRIVKAGGDSSEDRQHQLQEQQQQQPSTLCLHDSYTWKEHPDLAKCQSNIGRLYGSRTWWNLRGRLLPHPRYRIVMRCFFQTVSSSSAAVGGDDDGHNNGEMKKRFQDCLKKQQQQQQQSQQDFGASSVSTAARVLGIHVRRGDYSNFCKGLAGSRGIRTFRVPPYKWLSKKSRALTGRFPDTCAQSDRLIIEHVKGILDVPEAAIRILFVASNSATLVSEIRKGLSLYKNVRVVSLADVLGLFPSLGEWPSEVLPKEEGGGEAEQQRPRFKAVSLTDKATLDIIGLAASNYVVLNRYSTFSQSVIDERTLHGELLDWKTLAGAENVFWW